MPVASSTMAADTRVNTPPVRPSGSSLRPQADSKVDTLNIRSSQEKMLNHCRSDSEPVPVGKAKSSVLQSFVDFRTSSVAAVEKFYWEKVADRLKVPHWAKRHLSYYRLHMAYFLFIILIGSIFMWWNPGSSTLAYVDALFLATSATCVTGLTTVDMASLDVTAQITLFVLILLGNQVILSLIPVLVRRYYYKAYVVRLALRHGLSLDPNKSLQPDAMTFLNDTLLELREPGRTSMHDLIFQPLAAEQGGFVRRVAAEGEDADDRFWVPESENVRLEPLGGELSTTAGKSASGEEEKPESATASAVQNAVEVPPTLAGQAAADKTADTSARPLGLPDFKAEGSFVAAVTNVPAKPVNDDPGHSQSTETSTSRAFPDLRGVDLLENLEQWRRERVGARRRTPQPYDVEAGHSTWHASYQTATNLRRRVPPVSEAAAVFSPSATLASDGSHHAGSVLPDGEITAEPVTHIGGTVNINTDGLPTSAVCGGDYLEESAKLLRSSIEYRALCLLTWMIISYFIVLQLLGFLLMMLNFTYNTYTIDYLKQYSVNAWWLCLFLSISSFNNAGFSLLAANMMPFYQSPLVLLPSAALVLFGNTMYPIMMRWYALLLRRLTRSQERRETLDYLLKYPRRCFTHMFPAWETRLLLLVLVAFNVVEFVAFEGLNQSNLNQASMGPVNGWTRIMEGIFQSISTRNAGLNVVNLFYLDSAMTFLYMGLMYVAVYPLYLTRQRSQVREEALIDRELGITRELPDDKGQNVWTASRSLVARDSVFLFVCMFIVMIIQRELLPPNTTDIAWNVFSVVFEVVSAYGNVGLSIGYPTIAWSFCGVWYAASKVVLIVVMVMGRHRGLPDNIDSALRLPGITDPQVAEGIKGHEKQGNPPNPAGATKTAAPSDGSPGDSLKSLTATLTKAQRGALTLSRSITRKIVGENPKQQFEEMEDGARDSASSYSLPAALHTADRSYVADILGQERTPAL